MKDKVSHIALIPARKGSSGFKNKNSKFFQLTANFVKKMSFIDKVYVTTNDPLVAKKARKEKFLVFQRSEKYAKSNISIKDTVLEFCNNNLLEKNVFIWLLYIPIVNRNIKDFNFAKKILEKKKYKSLMTFFKSDSHPYNCWQINKNNKIKKYIKNNIFRRQDLPKSYEHHHYICVFQPKDLKHMNDELISKNTYPLKNIKKSIYEIDTYNDYKKWKN